MVKSGCDIRLFIYFGRLETNFCQTDNRSRSFVWQGFTLSLQCFDFCEDRMLCNEVRKHNIIISSNNRVETTSHEPCTGVCVPDIDFTPIHNCESRKHGEEVCKLQDEHLSSPASVCTVTHRLSVYRAKGSSYSGVLRAPASSASG